MATVAYLYFVSIFDFSSDFHFHFLFIIKNFFYSLSKQNHWIYSISYGIDLYFFDDNI